MHDIDTIVQSILTDYRLTPQERAVEAAFHIDRYVREEDDIPVNFPLPIPVEWAHRVPAAPTTSVIKETKAALVTEVPNHDTKKKGWFRR